MSTTNYYRYFYYYLKGYKVEIEIVSNDPVHHGHMYCASIRLPSTNELIKIINGFKTDNGAVVAANHWIDQHPIYEPIKSSPGLQPAPGNAKLFLRLILFICFFCGFFLAAAILSTTELLLVASIGCEVIGVLGFLILVRWYDELV